MYNKIYRPVFEKQKTIDANEKAAFQLSETLRTHSKKEDPRIYL